MPQIQNEKLICRLGILGLVPFIAGPLMQILQWYPLGIAGPVFFVSYSAIILSFLAGTLWAKARIFDNEMSFSVLIASNVLSLLAWLCLLLDALLISLSLLALAFPLLLYIEKRAGGATPEYYVRLRTWLSGIVFATHIAMIALAIT